MENDAENAVEWATETAKGLDRSGAKFRPSAEFRADLEAIRDKKRFENACEFVRGVYNTAFRQRLTEEQVREVARKVVKALPQVR